MPSTIDRLPPQGPTETISTGSAKVRVMHDAIQRRVSENQDLLSFIKEPKSLDKRESKIYSEAQKARSNLEALLLKKDQLYAQKKELKDTIPVLAQELETQKDNFKTFKQKDKVTTAQKNLKQAQKAYGKLRKELNDLEQKITKMQVQFNNDAMGLRKTLATKGPAKALTERFYPEETRQKIETIVNSLPQEKRAVFLELYQAYDNLMTDSEEFHDSILLLMTQIAEGNEDTDTSPHLEALNSLITKEKTAIESDPVRKERAQKILQERTRLLMDRYSTQSGAVQQARFAIETLLYAGRGVYDTSLAEVTSQALLLFSPRLAFYQEIQNILLKSSYSTNDTMRSNEIRTLLEVENQYVKGSTSVQSVSDKIKSYHVNQLILEDDRELKEKRGKIDLEIRHIFINEIAKARQKHENARPIIAAYKAYLWMPPRADLRYYEDLKTYLQGDYQIDQHTFIIFQKFLSHHKYTDKYFKAEPTIDSYHYKNSILKMTANERLLMSKVAKERHELSLELLKKSNPAWGSNIQSLEREIFPSLAEEDKNALKDILKKYLPDAADDMPFNIKYDPTVDHKINEFVKNWTQNKGADFQTQLRILKVILHPYNEMQPLVMPLFQEDLENVTFTEPA